MMKHVTLLFLCTSLTLTLLGQSCAISNLTVTPHSCNNGMFLVDVDFDIVNPDGDIFGVVGNATNYGFFMLEDLPVTLGPLAGDGETVYEFIVYNLGDPSCQETFTLGTYDCCTISNVVVDQRVCTSTSAYRARINLSHENTGNVGFNVFSETGGLLGSFLYANLPVTVNNIPSFSIGPTYLTLCDVGSSTCCTIVEYNDPDCNMTDCEIFNVTTVTSACEDGDFTVTIDFDHLLAGANFSVVGNGNTYGPFQYSALPVTLGPFEGDGETNYQFTIMGAGIGNNCDATFTIGTIDCPPGCGFNDVVIETMECRGDFAYTLEVDFVPISQGELGFSVYAEGVRLDSFGYNQLPVIVDSFPSSGDFFDFVTICDNADTSCCYEYEFRALLCEDCVINNIEINPLPCDGNDQFYVSFDFYYYNQGDSFQIGGSQGVLGNFSYDQLPLTLGPFNGDSLTYYEFLVFDLENGFCFDGAEFGFIDCDCDIDDVSVVTIECTGNGFYSLALDFTPIETTNAGFDVYGGGEYLGYYLYANLPVIIPAFPETEDPIDVITICDHDNPTCCVDYAFVGRDCVCEISSLTATPSECDELTNTFDLVVDFEVDGNVIDYEVLIGNTVVGTIQSANLPATLNDLSTNVGASMIEVRGVGHPDCSAFETIVNPCQGPCEILDLSVVPSACNPETFTFDITVDFDWIGEATQFFVRMNGNQIALVNGAALPQTITGLSTFGGPTAFEVCASERPDCCASIELNLEQCVFIPCDIRDLVASPGACTSDTTFAIAIAFSYEGFTNDSFDLWSGTTFLGQFPVSSLPLMINDFAWNGLSTMDISVCQTGDPACCESIEFAVPYCGCEIVSFDAIPLGYCNMDSVTFPIILNAQWLGEIDSFAIYADTQLIAVVASSSLPDTIHAFPIPEGEGELAEITICASDDATCCASGTMVPPDCDAIFCTISIISIDTFQCTGTSTFSAWVDYVTEGNTGPIQFWANDVFLGEYQQFHPLLLLNIPETGEPIVLRVCMADNPNCCTEATFDGKFCPDQSCAISNITASVVFDGNSDTTFSVVLDFDFENEGAAFTVFGNGNQYGVFGYNEVPITIPGLMCDTTLWQFVVQDLQNIGCLDAIDVGHVMCIDGLYPDPGKVLPLQIYYNNAGAHFVLPENSTSFSMWTYDGRLIHASDQVQAGEHISLSKLMPLSGLYIVQVTAADRIYVGKVVGF